MCKYQKKHKRYEVIIKFKDNKEKVYITDVDDTDYKKMVKEYNNAKNKFKNNKQLSSVCLLGIKFDNTKTVMANKEYNIDTQDNTLNIKTVNIIDEVSKVMKILKEKEKHHKFMAMIKDKQRDMILHNIEQLGKLKENNMIDFETYEKYSKRYYKNLEVVCIERRFHKEECIALVKITKEQSIDSLTVTQLSKLANKLHKSDKSKKALNIRSYEDLKSIGVYQEEKYDNNDDSRRLIYELKDKYNFVYDDKYNKVIYAYNNCKQEYDF